jgi:hypothetical protein
MIKTPETAGGSELMVCAQQLATLTASRQPSAVRNQLKEFFPIADG